MIEKQYKYILKGRRTLRNIYYHREDMTRAPWENRAIYSSDITILNKLPYWILGIGNPCLEIIRSDNPKFKEILIKALENKDNLKSKNLELITKTLNELSRKEK